MSILNVNKINPVGGGSTITIAGIASVTSSISIASSCTATTYYGDGSNLTGAGPTLSSGSNDRVITATGANALLGEANLTFSGSVLNINGTSDDTPLMIDTASNNGAHLRFRKDGSNQHFVGSGGGFGLGDKEDLSLRGYDNILFATGNSSTERMRISSLGHVTKPTNPSFRATASSSLDYTSDNTLAFQNEKHDVGGYYNNSNSYYTIPTTGYYKFEVMHFAQPGQIARVQLERSTDSGSSWSTIQIGPRIESSGGGRYIAGWMHVFHEFTATNLVRVRWSQGNVHINNGYGWFQGWLVQ